MKWREISLNYEDLVEHLRARSPCELLEIPEGSSKADARASYLRLVKKYHPDRIDPFLRRHSQEILKLINSAYDNLT